MERLTDKIGNTNCVKGCGSNCKYGFQYCRKEDWENCETIADVIDKLADYEDLGYTPEELKVCFVDTPEVLYAIDNNGEEDEKVYPIYPVDGQQIEYGKNGIYWNCRDDYGDYVTLPLSGLHYDYFVDRDEAEEKLKELRGSNE